MSCAARSCRRSDKNAEQLVFSFAAAPKKPKRVTLKPTRPTPAAVAPHKEPQPIPAKEDSLRHLCGLLHQLAQKYVARSNFQDLDTLVQTTKILEELGVSLPVVEDLRAPVSSYNTAVVTHAPQYRLLRSRCIAALATIADISSKAPAKGSPEFQRGMKAGFDYASDIAVFFLEDLEAAYQIRK